MSGPERPAQSEVTRMLQHWSASSEDRGAADRLFVLVYDELRALAAATMRRERAGHTLQPTALVHEAFLRLVAPHELRFDSRAHFFGIAARAMRQILVDHARRRTAAKRGGGWERVTLSEDVDLGSARDIDVIDLDQALVRFEAVDGRAARIVELRVFAGMTVEESAAALGVSKRTVDNDWAMARLWLARELTGSAGPGTPAPGTDP